MSRRRFVFDRETKTMVEVGADFTGAERRAPVATEELVFGKLGTATDGTRIDTRRRHREYMKANGLALTDDFKNTWQKAASDREAFFAGETPALKRERREDMAKAYEQLQRSRRR